MPRYIFHSQIWCFRFSTVSDTLNLENTCKNSNNMFWEILTLNHWNKRVIWSTASSGFDQESFWKLKVCLSMRDLLLTSGTKGLKNILLLLPFHKNWSFPLRISSVNVTKLRIWSNLLKKSLTENFMFCALFDCYAIHLFLKLKSAQQSIQIKESSHKSFHEESTNETFFKTMP